MLVKPFRFEGGQTIVGLLLECSLGGVKPLCQVWEFALTLAHAVFGNSRWVQHLGWLSLALARLRGRVF